MYSPVYIQATKKSYQQEKMSLLHKEKERLRHQKQVKLLNKVMEHVPKIANVSQTKVRNLRHLVLYSHYLRMVHSQLTKGMCTATVDIQECVKAAKPVTDIKKEVKRKSPRAHIVFLHADKSVNHEDNANKHMLIYKDAQAYYDCQESALPANYEYKIPEVMPIDGRSNGFKVDQENPYLFKDANNSQMVANYPISSKEYAISPKSNFVGNYENTCNDLESNLSSEDLLYFEKENYQPITTDNTTIETSEKELIDGSSLYDVERCAQSVIINDENLKANKHKPDNFDVFHKDSESYILTDLKGKFSKTGKENFNISTIADNYNRIKEYELNSYRPYTSQSVSSDYTFLSPTANYPYQNSASSSSNLYKSEYYAKSIPAEPLHYKSSFPESMSDVSSSSSSTDKIKIDVENLSDSNPSNFNFSDSSNSIKSNSFELPANLNCDNELSVKSEPMQSDPNLLPLFPSHYNYFGNNIIVNEGSFRPMYDIPLPCFNSIYPTSINCNRNYNSALAFPPESFHVFHDKVTESRTSNDLDSFYSPFNDSFQTGDIIALQPKSELASSNYLPESFSREGIKSFFEEESSYPLAQYFSNY